MTRQPHTIPAAHCSAALLLLTLASTLGAATYGPPLIARPLTDSTAGAILLYQQVVPQGETVVSFSFFNNNPTNRNWITPVVLQAAGGDNYNLIGVGTSRQNTGAGIQKHPFDLLYGSALASGPGVVFGWWNGRVVITGGQINLSSNAGLVALEQMAANPGYRESCVRANTNPCSVFPAPTLPTFPFGNVYTQTPVQGNLSSPYGRVYSMQFESVEIPVPLVTAVRSLTGFGGSAKIAPGGWVEIFGSRFTTNAPTQWSATDFLSDVAPTLLDGVRVTIGNRPAFIAYVAPGQINCVVPDALRAGPVDVIVTNSVGSSIAFRTEVAPRVPSLLAPAQFNVNGKQYVVAQHPDQVFAGPENLIPGAAFRLPEPGSHLTIYAVSLGETIPQIPSGTIARVSARVPNVQVRFADIPAQVEYAGPVSGLVGLSQLNVVIPPGVPTGDVRFTFSVDGVPTAQELWVAIQ